MSHPNSAPIPTAGPRSLAAGVGTALAVLLLALPVRAEPKLDVPYVPTPEEVVARMLELGNVGANDFVIDLGSGDGRIAIAAVKERGARGALGVDINPVRIAEAQENAKAAGVAGKVEFREQNLFQTDLTSADVITMYLLESVNAQLRPTLAKLKPGTRLVSHAFTLGDWEPDQTARVNGREVFAWVVPAQVAGRWAITDGNTKLTLDLKQSFQNVQGQAAVDGRSVPVKAKLVGDQIELTLAMDGGARTYRGKVNGSAIEPAAGSWRATRG
ncbi:SAM-dependent methyltransferase [Xanthobacter pseudotagetidis]|uniref:SAM-dependent methyltransferase n=1 Tax=Xanthobacter pseudotagetidis TaxID=3119911 RepID=UPI003727F16A